jgi:O-antigen/teichoic acid export membrane protein
VGAGNRLIANIFAYGVGGIAVKVISFFLLPVFTNYLTPEDYGTISLLISMSDFFAILFMTGFSTAAGAYYFESNEQNHRAKVIWSYFTLLTVFGAGFVITGYILAEKISWLLFVSDRYVYLVKISLITTLFSLLIDPFGVYLKLEQKARTFTILMVITTFLTVALNFLMVVVLQCGARGMIESISFSRGVGVLLMMGSVIFGFSLRYAFSLDTAITLFKSGLPLLPSSIFMFVMAENVKYVSQYKSGLDTVGLYQVGMNLALPIYIAVNSFVSAWLPFFMTYMHDQDSARYVLARWTTYYIAGFGAIALMFFVWAKPVVYLMTQPAYTSAYKVIGLIATGHFLLGVFYLLSPPMYYARELTARIPVQLGAVVLGILLSLILIPGYGLVGAGLAFAGGYMIQVILLILWNFYRRKKYISIPYEWRKLGFTMSFFVLIAFLTVLRWDLPMGIYDIMVSAVITVIVTSYLILIMGKDIYEKILMAYLQQIRYKFRR